MTEQHLFVPRPPKRKMVGKVYERVGKPSRDCNKWGKKKRDAIHVSGNAAGVFIHPAHSLARARDQFG